MNLLSVNNLQVTFGDFLAVNGISFELNKNETLAIVGESGSGKSVSALSILKLLPNHASISGSIKLKGQEILTTSPEEIRQIRGRKISMVFQEPMTSLNPLHSLKKQIGEALWLHQGLEGDVAKREIIRLLQMVKLPENRLEAFPHELSGGQRQRAMIAMALANKPEILIADEPTTALDVTVQAQILKLLSELQEQLGMAILFITHDLSIVRKFADRVAVMYKGEIVEQGKVLEIFHNPQHEYTNRLLESEPGPKLDIISSQNIILKISNLKVHFPIKTGLFRRITGNIKAVDGISINLNSGQTLGVVGESGSGKTTLGLAILRLISSNGEIIFNNTSINYLNNEQIRSIRKEMQIVFQDPFASLSPRMSVFDIVSEGLIVHNISNNKFDLRRIVGDVLMETGIDPELMDRYPHEFSGGQRQRISIARALVLKPRLLILDEPTSALDLSIQTQIIELLRNLQNKYCLSYIFISHDLRVIRALADQILVMKNGQSVEYGDADTIFNNPSNEYTISLIAAGLNMETI